MREVMSHVVKGHQVRVEALDDGTLNPGGASRQYRVTTINETGEVDCLDVNFKTAPNSHGVTNEALLLIVIDRLQGFQAGPAKCRENALALTKIEEAMHWLNHRTLDRVSRGVEGTPNG